MNQPFIGCGFVGGIAFEEMLLFVGVMPLAFDCSPSPFLESALLPHAMRVPSTIVLLREFAADELEYCVVDDAQFELIFGCIG